MLDIFLYKSHYIIDENMRITPLKIFILMAIYSTVLIGLRHKFMILADYLTVSHSLNNQFSSILQLSVMALTYLGILAPLVTLRFFYRTSHHGQNLSGRMGRFVRLCFLPHVTQNMDARCDNVSHSISSFNYLTFWPNFQSCLGRYMNYFKKQLGLDLELSQRSTYQWMLSLLTCVIGLQCSYILWGVMQERIMTKHYSGVKFQNSQYLVFCNRITSFVVLVPILCLPLGVPISPFTPGQRAPFVDYSFVSVTNVIASWCQYEALKFISFPTQVLMKACKVLPVMIMGKFIQRRNYTIQEYFVACLISLGMCLFLMTNPEDKLIKQTNNQDIFIRLIGFLLVIFYLIFDSFTSNWQDYLFRTYKLNSIQVMIGVNIWSVFLLLVPLIESNSLISSFKFGLAHPEFTVDLLLSSSSSALGQIFIFFTISQFGPATFVLIMILRLLFSLLVSCIIFTHYLPPLACAGVILVFISLFLKMYWRQTTKEINKMILQDKEPNEETV